MEGTDLELEISPRSEEYSGEYDDAFAASVTIEPPA
jgi:hypothetical protein